MCGIAGLLDFKNQKINAGHLNKMVDALKHRGPDDEGIYVNNCIGLGHTRLSIIDLSGAAHQPMPNEDKSVWLVFNGMIYNFRELRQELLDKGHIFRSCADSEVIVHLYEEEGKDCVKNLRGMFAFAIWDSKRRSLLLARDRIGQKPRA